MIDVLDAYDLIDHLVEMVGEDNVASARYAHPILKSPECIVGTAWFLAGVSIEDLIKLGCRNPRALWHDGELPLQMTLGASEVFEAAQRAQDDGTWGDARNAASRVVEKLVDIMPLTVVPEFVEVEEPSLVSV